MKPLLPAIAFATVLCTGALQRAHAALTILYKWEGVNLEIPDAPGFGGALTVSDTRIISDPYDTITDLTVWLKFEGSDGAGGAGTMWNGDLRVTLTHESGASLVLVNRIGRDGSNAFGASGSGMDFVLDPTSLVDVHLAGNGSLTGTFQPDSRGEDPMTVITASARNAGFDEMLGTFGGSSPKGAWTLAISDLEPGNMARLSGWGMTLSGVPEPETYAGMTGAALAGLWIFRRLRSNQAKTADGVDESK